MKKIKAFKHSSNCFFRIDFLNIRYIESKKKKKIHNAEENMDMNNVNVEADYYKIDDDLDVLFTSQAVKQIMLYEKTVELIGIIGHTEIRPNLMKFTLHNKSDNVIQILVWNKDIIENLKTIVMPGNVLHIDGAFAKHRNESLSAGNIEYDLNIMSNTKVRMLKESINYSSTCQSLVSNSITIPESSIEDCVKYSSTIQITGYIKNVISETSIPNSKINQGCLSDCKKYKLEIRMPILSNMNEYIVGSHVRVIGTIKHAQHPYIWVLNKEHIKFESEEKKPLKDLLKGSCLLKRRPLQDSSDLPSKKMLKSE